MTVPPERGIYYGPVYLVWSSENNWLWPSSPLSPHPQKGVKDGGDEGSWSQRAHLYTRWEVILVIGGSFAEAMGGQDIAYNTHVFLLGCPSDIVQEYGMGRPCKVVVLPAAISHLILKKIGINRTAAGWDGHASCWVLALRWPYASWGQTGLSFATKCSSWSVTSYSSLKLYQFIRWQLRLGGGYAGGVASTAATTETAP
jgi:hypothetical protein